MIIIEKPTKKSAGVAIINNKIYHKIKNKWIVCGDCNKKNAIYYKNKWHKKYR